MEITLDIPYLSLSPFRIESLPRFVVVTGVNGAGKTHLLNSLVLGKSKTDIAHDYENHIKCFDWSTLVPNDSSPYEISSIYTVRDKVLNLLQVVREKFGSDLSEWKKKFSVSYSGQYSWDVTKLSITQLAECLPKDVSPEEAYDELGAICKYGIDIIRGVGSDDKDFRTLLSGLIEREGNSILSLRESTFGDRALSWGKVDIFQQSFAQLFLRYFEKQRLNRLNRLDMDEGRTPSQPPLSETEFKLQFGPPPWDFVNEAIAVASLDFDIDFPTEYSATRFRPTLRKISSGIELQFDHLSSGEKILMSFAFCVYNTGNTLQNVAERKLLLFDEIDATLHPSMARRLIGTIQASLIEKFDVHVVMTTHSPTTVAVCPEDSLYVMKPGMPGIEKVSKQQAIAILTTEIPTLSINFDGRRQVFVESQIDAALYSSLYRTLKQFLKSERTLEFIGVGGRTSTGDQSSGCDQVRRVVDELSRFGNTSVLGLIDWDGKNARTDRVFVSAESERYSIENCLLDPLLLAALLIRTNRQFLSEFALPENFAYANFGSLTPSEKQFIISTVQRTLLEDQNLQNDLSVSYVNGETYELSSQYLHKNGHDLEAMVKQKYPPLQRFKNTGQLLTELAEHVVVDHPGLIPKPVFISFEQLLAYEFS